MRYQCPVLIVKDIEKSKAFYREVLGIETLAEEPNGATLAGGIRLQTEESWKKDTNEEDIYYGGWDSVLCFEEDNIPPLFLKLYQKGVPLEHKLRRNGRQTLRVEDPDGHVIEISDGMSAVCKRFSEKGMTVEAIAERTQLSVEQVKTYLQANE